MKAYFKLTWSWYSWCWSVNIAQHYVRLRLRTQYKRDLGFRLNSKIVVPKVINFYLSIFWNICPIQKEDLFNIHLKLHRYWVLFTKLVSKLLFIFWHSFKNYRKRKFPLPDGNQELFGLLRSFSWIWIKRKHKEQLEFVYWTTDMHWHHLLIGQLTSNL